jgi:GR25 family glycosyltransferase involved in LPS biosynthesis
MRVEDLQMVCISLDRRPDRWAIFQKYAQAARLNVQRHSAVDAKQVDLTNFPRLSLGTAHNIKYNTRRSHYEIDAVGAVGCSLSHFAAWEKLRASSAPAMIIFEDDAPIQPDFAARLAQILTTAPHDWDLIQFHMSRFDNGAVGCKPIGARDSWHACDALTGSHAYMISQEGARKMLDRAYPIEMHVDAFMAYMSRMGHVRMLWHPLIDLPSPDADSDIAHGFRGIMSVPTNMEKSGVVVLDHMGVWGLVTMAAVVGGLVALAYVVPRRR